VPAPLATVAGVVATSSLYVYVTHWQVYPHWENTHPWFATAASFAVGIAYCKVVSVVTRRLVRWWRARDLRLLVEWRETVVFSPARTATSRHSTGVS
jgi:hypothetical protein